jgi:hypothetical protein
VLTPQISTFPGIAVLLNIPFSSLSPGEVKTYLGKLCVFFTKNSGRQSAATLPICGFSQKRELFALVYGNLSGGFPGDITLQKPAQTAFMQWNIHPVFPGSVGAKRSNSC